MTRAEESLMGTPATQPSTKRWTQVLMAAVLMVATFPGRTQALGLITEPLLRDLHLDRVNYAQINLWASLLGALFCFPAGWAMDRIGLRISTSVCLAGLVAAVVAFANAGENLGAFFVILLATRGLGQSALSVFSISTVSRWFPIRSGPAMAVYSILLSLFFAVSFGAVGARIQTAGWREAWSNVALVLAAGVVPLVVLVLRDPVRSISLKDPTHDGLPTDLDTQAMVHDEEGGATLNQALRTKAFWLFAGAAASFNLIASGLGLFNEAILVERGFAPSMLPAFLAGTALLSLGGQAVTGWMIQRFRLQLVSALSLGLYALGLAGLAMASQVWQLVIVAIPLGLAAGMTMVLFFSVWGELYGQRHLGRIQGSAQMVTVLSSAMGPVVFAWAQVHWNAFGPLLYVAAATVLLIGLAVRFLPLPERRSTPRTSE